MEQKPIGISKEIENYIREMEFKHRRIGGVDEEDVLLKMRDLVGLFRKQLDELETDGDMDGRMAQMRVNLEKQKTEAEAAEKKLRAEAQKAQAEAKAAREEAGKLKKQAEEAEAAAAKAKQAAGGAGEADEKLREEIQKAKAEAEKLQEECEASRQEADKLREEVKAAREETEAAKKDARAVAKQAEDHKKEITALKEKIVVQMAEADSCKKEIASLKEELAARASEAESRRFEEETRIREGNESRAEMSELREENRALRDRLEQTLTLNAQYSRKVEAMQEKINDYEREAQSLRGDALTGIENPLSFTGISMGARSVLDDMEKMRGVFLAMEETRAEKERLAALTRSIEDSKEEIMARARREAEEEARMLAAENEELRRLNDELGKLLRANTDTLRDMVEDVITRAENLRVSVFALENAQERRGGDAREVQTSASFLGDENWG